MGLLTKTLLKYEIISANDLKGVKQHIVPKKIQFLLKNAISRDKQTVFLEMSPIVNDNGVFSFCMCPGGLIVPAATAPGGRPTSTTTRRGARCSWWRRPAHRATHCPSASNATVRVQCRERCRR